MLNVMLSSYKVVIKLSESCHKVVIKLSESSQKLSLELYFHSFGCLPMKFLIFNF